ncbi:unnamed protein product (macronuclear) [Paramecium tetraurelia]|uniref:Uncharacterized protein n=1 Tax=Paramecium tetraurelia TaxID=5888 RepID=A0C7G5_PARTE|nr:uncharacterized protein GSPATT00035862001 [Paramecium tetraurelia]CAK66732.1 unnamed protein product [Paramecium tetraurelia]|eukprot:XP_001434129.1 hypothetical protein (macronuclear) [Paramecium tetraurelia strain d4-2]
MSDDDSNQVVLAITKVGCMITFFMLILIVGSLPIRLKAFKSNKKLLAYMGAFSGGLFLAVGLVHLLPEAAENFEQSFDDDEEHFPFAYAISIASFALILFIEKIITDHHHDHGHDEDLHHHGSNSKNTQIQDQNQLFVNGSDTEETFKDALNTQLIVAKKASFVQMVRKSIAQDPKNSIVYQDVNTWAPYILQIAVGIHAVFEGLSIGIQEEVSLCIGIAVVVCCHKWAEGMTLGLAFRKAGVNKTTSTYMIMIQAIMNPVGIGIGWIMADKGPLYTGIFVSISVGTFIYISTMETLTEEFSISQYKWEKYIIFLVAIAFVSSLWFIEQAVGGE